MDSVDERLARRFLFSRFIVPVLIVDTCPVETGEYGSDAHREFLLPFPAGSAGSTLRKALE